MLQATSTIGEVADELVYGKTYEIVGMDSFDKDATDDGDLLLDDTDLTANAQIKVGAIFTVTATGSSQAYANDLIVREVDSAMLTADIEAVQAKINTARVQAGSQYAAIESAINYTTDLTAQYELGFNTVNDVNFSMETAHLAKNQILQQAATAMLAQANQGQQGLLQLIQA